MLDPMLMTSAIHAAPCPSLAESFLRKLNFKVPARVLRVAACRHQGATCPKKAIMNPQWNIGYTYQDDFVSLTCIDIHMRVSQHA